MPFTLDCQSESSIIESCCMAGEISDHEVNDMIDSFDFDKWRDDHPDKREWLPHMMMCEYIQRTLSIPITFDSAMYFHGCRCISADVYLSNGLLPTDRAIDSIWKMIFQTSLKELSAQVQRAFRTKFESSEWSRECGKYWSRIHNDRGRDGGPYGKLVLDEWFVKQRTDNHYTLQGNEVVQMILQFYQSETGDESALDRYVDMTRPCIVKYLTDEVDERDVGGALYFLHCKRQDQDGLINAFFGLHCGCGKSIPISQVQWAKCVGELRR